MALPLAALPNGLTLLRLVLALCFPWLPAGWRLPAVLVGALTDFLDGFLSRRLHATSETGRLLDPIADKLFMLMVAVTLIVDSTLSIGEALLLGLRDLTVAAGALYLLLARRWSAFGRMRPNILGKAATWGQFAFLALLLVEPRPHPVFLILAATLSGLAAIDYVRFYLRGMPPREPAGDAS